ncbi:hypothetical protein BHM03_00029512 [Ensete ventricosum]|uniref:Uncharacterized protein n=1 Tax=Ensete ventricosum TaxID=4639 RepID=A0A426Y7W6_ENSVE|nr:hypothetical protein B296_00032511 [Ensete ventricosum]RZR99881.1 hypothetical protein BHM03_00029512 [Ensete ventricosum]
MAIFSFPPPSLSASPLPQPTRCPFLKPQIAPLSVASEPRHRRILRPAAAAPEIGAVEEDQRSTIPLPQEESGVAASVKVLKAAAKTRKVPAPEVLAALAVIKKEKSEPSSFLETLGGTESPGRTWMLIFTAQVISSACYRSFGRLAFPYHWHLIRGLLPLGSAGEGSVFPSHCSSAI